MKRGASLALALALLAGSLPSVAAKPPSGREVMSRVAQARRLAGSEAVVRMTIVNARGQSRVRKLALATKLYDGGKTEKRVYRFLSPAEVQGTGVLIFDYQDRPDDVWVHLPALRKTRRITSAQRSKRFLGSEFSYADLNVPPLADYRYQVRGQEAAGGEPCWVVDVLPAEPDVARGEGYSKKTYWVSQSHFVIRRGLYYDLAGQVLKELRTGDVRLLDEKRSRYRPSRMEMHNRQTGGRSVFQSEEVEFSPGARDEYFTKRYLERR